MKGIRTLLLPFGVLTLLGSAQPARADLCAYVAASGAGGGLTVVDVASQSEVADVYLDGPPLAVAVDPAGQAVYVLATKRLGVPLGAGDDTTNTYLSVLESTAYAVVKDIPVPASAATIVVSPDGRFAYLEDPGNGGVDVVDLSGGAFARVIRTGAYDTFDPPLRFAISSDGTRLFVPAGRPAAVGTVLVIDTASGTIVDTIAFLPELEDPEPVTVVLSPNDGRAYVGLEWGNGQVPVLDLATGAVADVLDNGGQRTDTLALSADGAQLYAARFDPAGGQLAVIDTQTKATTVIPLGMAYGEPMVLAVAPASHVVYAAWSLSSLVFAVDTQARAVVARIPTGENPRDIAVGRINGPCRPVDYTPQPTATPTPTPTATPTKVPLPQCPEGLPCLSVSSATGRPGDDLTIEVRLHSAGQMISGTQNDILWDSGVSLHACAAGDSSVRINTGYSASSLRALVFSDSGQGIADGTVLYRCTLSIAKDASLGTYYLRTVHIYGSEPTGMPLSIIGADGTVLVSGATQAQPQAAASSGGGGCTIAGRKAPQWSFLVMLLLPLLGRLLRRLGHSRVVTGQSRPEHDSRARLTTTPPRRSAGR